jgi:hypothetical protein
VIHPRDHDLIIATHCRGIWIIDDITPLRHMGPSVLDQEVLFVPSRPTVQRLPAWGGWANGDAAFIGANPSTQAVIAYYQKKRHIFGDLRMEVFDQAGRSLGTLSSSKRRGLNRAGWEMRLPPPRVPSGATGLGGASRGPRVIPGTYTVRLTKGDRQYQTALEVRPDPRSTATAADRKAQFDLVMKLYGLLEDMTFEVDRINGLRSSLEARAAQLGAADSLAGRLLAAAAEADAFRRKIVATREGGMITGEEREFAGDLYGNVAGYEGQPSQTQVERTAALARELADLAGEFTAWASRVLPGLNGALGAKKLDPLSVLERDAWERNTRKK